MVHLFDRSSDGTLGGTFDDQIIQFLLVYNILPLRLVQATAILVQPATSTVHCCKNSAFSN